MSAANVMGIAATERSVAMRSRGEVVGGKRMVLTIEEDTLLRGTSMRDEVRRETRWQEGNTTEAKKARHTAAGLLEEVRRGMRARASGDVVDKQF
jgi:hypothetical protein